MSNDCRYVLHKSNERIDIEDTLHTRTLWMGIKNVDAIGLSRSDLEALKRLITQLLDKP